MIIKINTPEANKNILRTVALNKAMEYEKRIEFRTEGKKFAVTYHYNYNCDYLITIYYIFKTIHVKIIKI